MSRPFTAGVLAPLTTPFNANGDVDLEALQAQAVRVASAGMGLVLMGTNGEAAHMTSEERISVIRGVRTALDKAGLNETYLLVGTGGQSARETIKLSKEAKEAGADYAIVITPGYFAFVMGKDRAAITQFFFEVADASPLPVMVYNFPGAASGIDLDSDHIIELSEHQNIVGVKLTCAAIGKGQRIVTHVKSAEYKARHKQPFLVMPGFADYMLPSLVSGQDGVITGTGNIIPKTMVHCYKLGLKALTSGDPADLKKAQDVQAIVSQADWIIIKAGIAGTKYALDTYCSTGAKLGQFVRSPLPQTSDATKKMVDEGIQEALAFEKSLP